MVPLDTLIAVFDKIDKIILSESSKMLRSKSRNEKKKICQKRKHFSFRMFLWTLRLQFSLSCLKVSAKLSKKILLQVWKWKKNQHFTKKSFFLQESCSSGQLKCSFEHLAKKFLPIIWKNFCINPEKNEFFKRNVFFVKNFLRKRRMFF